MVKDIRGVECDICGKIEALKYVFIRNEEAYALPDGWVRSRANGNVTICPECNKKLEAHDERRSL